MLKNTALLFICVFALAKCNEEITEPSIPPPEIEKGIYILTGKNFISFMDQHPYVLVKFYAPWCGHCKALAPKYEAVAAQIKDKKFGDKEVVLAKVDATVETDLATQFEIQGYPTLKWFANGQVYEFDSNGRDESDLLEFIDQHADPNWQPPKSVVLDLTGANFTEFVESHEISLVEFYAPWCGHCKRLAPEYEKAARKLNERKTGAPIPLARMDATAAENKDVVTKYEVQGYPTLKVFRKGRVFDFKSKGQPDENQIIGYMERQAQPPSRMIPDSKMFKKALETAEEDIVMVGFFESETDPFYQTYFDAANELRDEDFKFSHVFGSEMWKEHGITKPTVAVFMPSRFQTKHEPKRYEFTNTEAPRSELVEFIMSHSVPLVGHFTQTTREKRYNTRRPLCLFFYSVDFSREHREATQMWRRKIADIANDFRDITFAVANDEEHENVMREMGLEDSSEEMNVACYDAKGTKYPLDPPMEEWSDKKVRNFLNKMKNGKLKPFYKSQAVPQKGREMDGNVVVVVGKTFEEIVMKSDKDVLLFLHAPWCGHCKNFAPEYKKLADKVIPQEGDKLILAKIDATANDVPPGYLVQGFPTLYFAPVGRKDTPIKYEGNRLVDDIVTFMKKNSAKAFITSKKTAEEDTKEEL